MFSPPAAARSFGFALALALGFSSSGLAPTAPASPAEAPTLDLGGLITEALANSRHVVLLPKGTFQVSPSPVDLSDIQDLTIEGKDTTLLGTDLNRYLLTFHHSKAITLRGFTIDFQPLPFTQGTVIARAAGGEWCDVRLHVGYPDFRPEFNQLHLFAAQDARWKNNTSDPYASAIEDLGNRVVRVHFDKTPARIKESIAVGDYLAFATRAGGCVKFDRCDTVRIEDVTLASGPGFGVMCRFVNGDNYFRFKIGRGPAPAGAALPRLLSINADGLNIAYSRKGPTIEDCDFSFMGDDSVNLHGFIAPIVKIARPDSFYVAVPRASQPFDTFIQPGDTIRLLDQADFAIKGHAGIKSFVAVQLSPQDLAAFFSQPYSKRIFNGRPGAVSVFLVTLDHPVEVALVNDFIDVPQTTPSGFAIRRNFFHDHRGFALRLAASQGVIEDNRIERIRAGGIALGPNYGFWREAGWVADITVRRNVLRDIGLNQPRSDWWSYGAIAVHWSPEGQVAPQKPVPGENRRITIEDNLIDGCNTDAIWINGATDVTIRGNKISHVDRDTSLRGNEVGPRSAGPVKNIYGLPLGDGITISDAGEVTVSDNQIAKEASAPPSHAP